ncbi:hypothetical protein [Spirulina sp. 06S082]|uniref:hypothetical protein n=1 Tax=Spirulina sp. 06S082 TaxID=3110248 RepID=UPI002B1EF28B|nr:hypothetical protein [Spirulina sp. 06S082]MEA5468450.1 hypothetical protein [Spirulina sp. 06S082]
MLAAFFLTSSATAYLFSGSVCYLALRAEKQRQGQPIPTLQKLEIPLFWPLWIAKEMTNK